jgi:hypothetical protein
LSLLTIGLTGCQDKKQTIPDENTDPPALPEYIQAPLDKIGIHVDIINLDRFYQFVNNVEQGKKDEIRVVSYTTKGAPILHDLKFNGFNHSFNL